MILGQVVERNAQLYPEQTALIFEDRAIKQRDWAALVRRSAQALAALGIKRHGRVAILAKNSPEYLAVYLAAGLAGFTAIGINYRLSGPEQAQIVRDCERPPHWHCVPCCPQARRCCAWTHRLTALCPGNKRWPQPAMPCPASWPSRATPC
jgi:acyl-CoA synthetase (AMP-forming)/AMP-acid ligase II